MAKTWPLSIKEILEDLRSPASYRSWRHNLWALAQLIPDMYSAQYVKEIEVKVDELLGDECPYFDVTGTGTQADPYIIKPKTTVFHGWNIYKLALVSEPAVNTYVFLQASGNDRCIFKVNHPTVFSGHNFLVNVLDIDGSPRPRITTPANTISRAAWDSLHYTYSVAVDLNSPSVYYSSPSL